MLKYKNILGYALIVFGLILIFYNGINSTGAFAGFSNLLNSTRFFLGLLSSTLGLLIVSEGGLEKRINLTSKLGKKTKLARLAEKATENERVQDEMNHLLVELAKGHIRAGSGTRHIKGTDVWYMRGSEGARLFYRETKNGYEIVGKAFGGGKKVNEFAVIKKLKELYSH
ncbi:MAG TPA: hypothetical protein VJB94_02545 [Candidatus Nanoarchaeia archaeon]|nr:hypothetical protein [Candidatus Nanoarchaeia archaeon]